MSHWQMPSMIWIHPVLFPMKNKLLLLICLQMAALADKNKDMEGVSSLPETRNSARKKKRKKRFHELEADSSKLDKV